jgi:anaerobic magnesium-protoporphyrin IX monomethyl ester cyclase
MQVKKIRILLINPPYSRFLGQSNTIFPMSFGNIATMLSNDGYDVGIYDADFDLRFVKKTAPTSYFSSFCSQNSVRQGVFNRDHEIWQECRETIRSFQPDIVGITAMTSKFPMVTRIAEIVKEVLPESYVFIGGHHASVFGGELMKDQNFDFISIGEGEITVQELVQVLSHKKHQDFSKIRGLAYRENGEIITTEPRPLIKNLDDLPIANRDLVINPGYLPENNIIISRGCPFNCHYCGAKTIWTHKVRRRSIGNIISEIEYLFSRNKSRDISFWDDSFTCDRKFISELLKKLRKFAGLHFSCITRLDLIDAELLAEMKAAGCSQILFGIESGSDRVLQLIDKKLNVEQIKRQTSVVDKAGILWLGFFLIGYPGEKKEDIIETVAFMKELNAYWSEVNIFNPLPGTQIWNKLEAERLVNSQMDFSKNSQVSTEHCFVDDMSIEEFREIALLVAKEFDRNNSWQLYRRRLRKGLLLPITIIGKIYTKLRGYILFNFSEIRRKANKLLAIIEIKMHRTKCYSYPNFVHMLTQYECNCNCEFCGFDYHTNPLKDQLTLEKHKVIMRNIRPEFVMNMVFSGMGEPLLCNDFEKIIKYTREIFPHIKLMVNTNGKLLTGNKAELVANNLDTVVFSLHSLNSKTYATISGNKSLQTVLDNITYIRKINPNIKLTLYFAYSMRNIDEMKEHVEFCRKLGNCFYIGAYAKFYNKRRCFSDMCNSKLFHTLDRKLSLFNHQEHSDRMVREANDYAVKVGLKKYIFPPLFSNPFSKRINCTFPYSQIMLGPDGQVYPCGGSEVLMYEDITEGKLDFGNLAKSSIDEIWNLKDYLRLRTSSHGCCKYRSVEYCKNCSTMSFMLNSGRVSESHFVETDRK